MRKMFHQNYKALEKDLLTLDQALVAIVSKDPAKYFIGSHPVYDYFARRYGLNIKSVHWEPDEVPGDTQWMELQTILKTHPHEWMNLGRESDEEIRGDTQIHRYQQHWV